MKKSVWSEQTTLNEFEKLASDLSDMGIEQEFIDDLSKYELKIEQAIDLVDSIKTLRRV